MNGLFALALALGLAGCAGAPSREATVPDQWQYQGQKFGALRVSVRPSVQLELAGDGAFDLRHFERTVLGVLEEQGLFDRGSGYSVTVELTDVRLGAQPRWGRVATDAAGSIVTGTVTLKQPSGRILYAFDVNASYALGDADVSELLSGLYQEFAILTVIRILSGSEPTSAYASL